MNFYQYANERLTEVAELREKQESAPAAHGKDPGEDRRDDRTAVPEPGTPLPAQRRLTQALEGKKLSETVQRRLFAGRARKILQRPVSLSPERDEESSQRLRKDVARFFEKVHLTPDFLPASFLRQGAERARAVCRIPFRTAEGHFVGSGFLVAPGIIMTNNHVLDSAETAVGAVGEFDFEEGLEIRRVPFLPEQFFYTHADLDFTLVACDGRAVQDIAPVALRRNPVEIMDNERVNIVQHPRGRFKEVVLHDNRVTEVRQELVYYQADTEGGSSGSPVFNNQWELVGLHHWGQELAGGGARNRAIRIPAIVGHLQALVGEGHPESHRIGDLLEGVTDTNPLLGFFDLHGVVGAVSGREVEVPSFAGSREFVDVGFWNIEHFNDSVSQARVERVADVVFDLAMDTLGLVEVQKGALERLQAALRDRGLDMGFFVQNEPNRQDLAVLFDRDTTEVTHREDLLRDFEGILSRQIPEGSVFPRRPMFATCKVRQDGGAATEYLKIVVHLKAFTSHAPSRARRRAAAQALREIIDELRARPDAPPIVLGGDFNEFLTNDVLGGLTDAGDLLAMTADDAVSGAASYVGGPMSLIDHIMVTGDVRAGSISGDDAAIVRLDRSVADFDEEVSDHVPIVFRMVFSEGQIPAGAAREIAIPNGAARVRLGFADEQGNSL